MNLEGWDKYIKKMWNVIEIFIWKLIFWKYSLYSEQIDSLYAFIQQESYVKHTNSVEVNFQYIQMVIHLYVLEKTTKKKRKKGIAIWKRA